MSWIKFDIQSFLKASKHWEEDIAKLRQEMDSLSLLPSSGGAGGIQKNSISDMTASAALRRLEIQAEIEEIMLNKEMLAFALKRLTEDERRLIDGFFYPKKSIGEFVEEYGRDHFLTPKYVYFERSAALEKMRLLIEAEYYGE